MGWSMVRARGAPLAAWRSPMARKTASGQPKPLEELTVTVAPSGISAAASAAERTRIRGMALESLHSGGWRGCGGILHGGAAAALGCLADGQGHGQRADAVLA